MQKIYFKKLVNLEHQLKELVSISVDESIDYRNESQGMRAYGSIIINGDYKDNQNKNDFHETIDLDILAQFSKIEDRNEFNVKVEDFDYYILDGDLSLVIQACIYGVKDDEDRIIETDVYELKEEIDDSEISDEIESLIREQEVIETVEKIVEEKQVIQEIPQHIEILKEEKREEESDDEDLGTYYLYVVQDGDTYQSIANHYQVDEYRIKDYNHDRSLSKGTIVIIPYYS